MTGRALLDAIGQAVAEVRRLRHAHVDQFADITTEDLERATRGLERVAIDCTAGAHQLRRAIAARHAEAQQ